MTSSDLLYLATKPELSVDRRPVTQRHGSNSGGKLTIIHRTNVHMSSSRLKSVSVPYLPNCLRFVILIAASKEYGQTDYLQQTYMYIMYVGRIRPPSALFCH